jgi:hypothetical protein
MTEIRRRSILKTLAAMPFVGGIAKLLLFGGDASSESQVAIEHGEKGTRIMRLVNTLQNRNYSQVGAYASMTELDAAPSTRSFFQSGKGERTGIGESLRSTIDLTLEQISPGWLLKFSLRRSKQGYLALLQDVSGNRIGALSTDQKGVIFKGSAVQSDIPVADSISAKDLVVGAALGASEEPDSVLGSLFRSLSLGPATVFAQGGCMCTGNCCCAGHTCSSGCICNGCTNCGCLSCVWCCSL